MSKNIEVGVKITADSKGLVGESRAAKDALNQLGDSTRKVSADASAYTAQLDRQGAALVSLKSAVLSIGGAFASINAAKLVGEVASLSQRYQELGIVMNVAGRNAGLSAGEIEKTTEAVRQSGITMLQSRQTVISMIQANIDLSNATKLARLAQDAAVVGQLNSSEALDRLIYGLSTAQIEVLKTMGLNVNFERSYKKMADQLGKTTDELSDQERMQARLNVVYESGTNIVGSYEGAMNNAGKQYRSTQRQVEDLKVSVGGLFDETSKLAVTAYTGVLKDLTSEVDTLTSNGDIVRWGDNIAYTFAVAGDAARAAMSPVLILLKTVDAAIDRSSAILSGDFAKSRQIGADFDKFFSSELDVLTGSTKLQDALQKQLVARDLLTDAVGRGAKALKDEGAAMSDNASGANNNAKALKEREKLAESARREDEKAAAEREREAKQALESSRRIIDSLKRETAEIGLNTIQKKMMSAAAEAAKAPTEELRREIMASAQAWAVATQQEEENLAIKKRQADAADELARRERQAAEQTQRYWSGIWGDVEQTARMAFVQFAAHGKTAIESIGETLKVALIDVLYQLTVRKWMINIGASIGLGGSGMAMAGDLGGGGLGLLNAANLGSGALNLLKGGFGATSLIGGGLSKLGSFFGSSGLSAFGGGFAGDAIGGLAAGGFSSGAASMASMGASMASFAGPAIAIAAVDQITRMLAGDKMIGGGVGKVLNYVPVLGPLLNGLFGRGPMKQQGTLLSGEIGAEGFESGFLQTRFKAKGGLFRSDKIDYARVDAMTGEVWTDNNKLLDFAKDLSKTGKELFGLINDTTKQTSASLRQIGQDLGVSTEGVDKFKYSINLLSEKGKMLTEEQIGQEIEKITDGLARSLIPQVDELAKRGETALQTVARLGSEFTSLVDAAALVLGKSAADAKAFLSGSTYQGRAGFVEAAGGLDAFNQKVTFFAENFLTQAERLAPVQEQVNSELKRLGLSSDLTRDQFRGLVQSFGQVNGISEETLQALLNIQGAFVQVRTETKAMAEDQVGAAFAGLQKAVDAEKNAITQKYNDALKTVNGRIEDISQSVGKLRALSDALKSTVDQIRPLGRDQAKQQIRDAIAAANAGNVVELDSVRGALGVLGNSQTIGGFSGSFEFAREQAKSANLVASLGKLTDDQLTLDERSLAALEAQRDRLTAGFEAETARLDGLLTQGQAQIEALSGINTGVASLADAISRFNAASYAAGGGAIGGGSLGNPNITAQQIRDFVAQPGRTEMEIYNAAKANGVSFEQYAAATGSNIVNLNAWADKNNLPRFAKGGFHRGGLRIVGENGPELEATGPASIASNNDLTKLLNNDDVVQKLLLLIKEIQDNNEYNRRVANKLDAATTIVNGQVGLRTGTS